MLLYKIFPLYSEGNNPCKIVACMLQVNENLFSCIQNTFIEYELSSS